METVLPPAIDCLVCKARTRSSLAQIDQPLPSLGQRGDAAADAGGDGQAVLSTIYAGVSDRQETGGRR